MVVILLINTGNQEDYVHLEGGHDYFYVGGHTSIDTGDGDDDVVVYGDNGYELELHRNLTINTGDGADSILIGDDNGDVYVGGNTKIDTGADSDEVRIATDYYDTTFDGKLDILTRGGEDYVGLLAYAGDVRVEGHTSIDTGADGDEIVIDADGYGDVDLDGNLNVTTAGGEDDVEIDANDGNINVGGHAKFDLGNDADVIDIEGAGYGYEVDFFGRLEILVGSGDDIVDFYQDVNVFGSTKVHLGGGDDVFGADGAGTEETVDFYGRFDLKGEGGDDEVFAGDYVYFFESAKFDGGDGYDEIDVDDASFYGALSIKKFEFIA
jgi:hypothetical protein